MDPQLMPFILTRYEEIIKDVMSSDLNIEVFNTQRQKNESIVDVLDLLFEDAMIDGFKSANPTRNFLGTQLLTNNIFRDQTLLKFGSGSYQRSINNDILYSRSIMDSVIGQSMYFEDANSISYNSLFVNIDQEIGGLSYDYEINDYLSISPINLLNRYKKTNDIDPFSGVGVQNQYLHNLFGTNDVDYVYPGLAVQNGNYFASRFSDYYEDIGLVSPNRGFFGSIGASVTFSFSSDGFYFGVRNDYGEIPITTRFFLQIMKDMNYYYNSHGEILLRHAMLYIGL